MRQKLQTLLRFMLQTNQKINLTAIRDPEEAWVRHVEDSLALLQIADFQHKRVLDVGSGAGFPGMVLAIAVPNAEVTLLDATGKKVAYLRDAARMLELDNVRCVQARAEQYAHTHEREAFDIVTARGVASLDALCELCLPLVRVGGLFLAMKENDRETARESVFGGERRPGVWYDLPGERRHYVAVFAKITPSPEPYPRAWTKIKDSARTKGG